MVVMAASVRISMSAVCAAVVLSIVFSIQEPNFATERNFWFLLRQNFVYGILAVGMTFVILTGGIDLSIGSVVAFAGGRWLGAHYVKNLVSKQTWDRMGFIVEAEGAILCFIIFLIPGLPKDIVCYLFGLSPMPMWVFALVQGVGRIPGTWVLSAQGAHTAAGHYYEVFLITALCLAVALPLYYYRHRIVARLRGRLRGHGRAYRERLDRNQADS